MLLNKRCRPSDYHNGTHEDEDDDGDTLQTHLSNLMQIITCITISRHSQRMYTQT